jgi:hypothetical protein
VARGFDHRVPAATIVWQARLTGPTVLRSELSLDLRYEDALPPSSSTMSAQAR